jgi:hypothetical protein
MNFEERPPKTDREYNEMLYSLITETNGVMLAQVRNINNTMSKILLNMIDLQNALNVLNLGLKDTRDKRYQEEIDALELRIETMRKQVEEKKVAKETSGQSTSQEIRSVALDVITKQRDDEIKRKEIPWIQIRNSAITAAVTIAVLWLLPQIGDLLRAIFAK